MQEESGFEEEGTREFFSSSSATALGSTKKTKNPMQCTSPIRAPRAAHVRAMVRPACRDGDTGRSEGRLRPGAGKQKGGEAPHAPPDVAHAHHSHTPHTHNHTQAAPRPITAAASAGGDSKRALRRLSKVSGGVRGCGRVFLRIWFLVRASPDAARVASARSFGIFFPILTRPSPPHTHTHTTHPVRPGRRRRRPGRQLHRQQGQAGGAPGRGGRGSRARAAGAGAGCRRR